MDLPVRPEDDQEEIQLDLDSDFESVSWSDSQFGLEEQFDEDGEPIVSRNEVSVLPLVEIPVLPVDQDTPIELVGHVAAVVGTDVIIEDVSTGIDCVLDEGTVLLTKDRKVFGTIAETFGPIKKPRYTVRFNKIEEAASLGVTTIGEPVYRIQDYSVWALTQQLKAMQGCDASNEFDEEIPQEAQEFSDDEKEREHGRKKLKRKPEKSPRIN